MINATSSARRSGLSCGWASTARIRRPRAIPVLDLRIADAAEAREYLKLQKLRIIETQRLGGVAQGLRLGLAADPAHAGADIDRRLVSLVEQTGIEDDLPVGDGDQIGRDIGAQVARIDFRDRQDRERSTAGRLAELCRPLKQARVDIEHVARISLAPWRLPREQRDLAVGRRMLGKVVDDDEGVLAAVAEIFRHRDTGKGRNPLQARRGGRARDYEDAAVGRAMRLDGVDDTLHR